MSYKFVEVGHTRKAVGFDGAIRLSIDTSFVADLIKAEAIFIETGYEIIPYFPISVKDDGEIIAQFDDVTDREKATALAGKPVYLRDFEVTAEGDTDQGLDADLLIGVLLKDQTLGDIGKVQSIESYPQQEMLIVDYNGNEIMIPLHMDLVVEFAEGETLVMDLPEGLLEI